MVMAETRQIAVPPPPSLLAAARAGDSHAIEQLLLPHEPTLRAVCQGMLGRRKEDVEDAVQETFLRALRGLESFRGEASLKTWLVKIAVHVCSARSQKSPTECALEENIALATPSPERAVVRQALLTEALATLSAPRRVALLLKAEGWTLEEIGQAQGRSVARVKVELFRARTGLAKWAQTKSAEDEGASI